MRRKAGKQLLERKSDTGAPSLIMDIDYGKYDNKYILDTDNVPSFSNEAIPPAHIPKMYDERPMVFALRSDPDVFVYEFTDRLEYYRKTDEGMLLLNTEKK